MEWKKIDETEDLIIFEKRTKDLRIRIEARLGESGWQIFKNYHDGQKSIFVDEYFAADLEEANSILNKLISEKDLTKKKIDSLNLMRNKKIALSLKRIYKDVNTEKWIFSVDNGPFNNTVHVRFNDEIDMDVIAHEKYAIIEKQMVDEIIKALGIGDMPKDFIYTLFYFNKMSNFEIKDNKLDMVIGKPFDFTMEKGEE